MRRGDDMVAPTVDTDLTEQFLANTAEPVREQPSASVELHELLQTGRGRRSIPRAGSASVTVTGVPGATSVKVKTSAGGELVATRKVDIG